MAKKKPELKPPVDPAKHEELAESLGNPADVHFHHENVLAPAKGPKKHPSTRGPGGDDDDTEADGSEPGDEQ